MYLRKSSDSDERQQLSIPAQERELAELAVRNQLTVVGEPIRESQSAKRPGRPLFDQMIQDIKAGKADGILCWHLDRLARNPIDGGIITWLLGEGTIKKIVTPNRVCTGTADAKLMMAIDFGMATKYSDDLSVNVKRGNRQVLEGGRWPYRVKLGYEREPKTMELVEDPERFARVKEMWKLRLSGVSILEILGKCRNEWNLRTPAHGKTGGKLLTASQLYALFKDPFYAGIMMSGSESFKGSHPQMITWPQFETVQAMRAGNGGRQPKPKNYQYLYRGMIFCGACNAMVTAERTVNRHGANYLYYHCCRKNRRYGYCPERSVQEGTIDQSVEKFLKSLVLSDKLVAFLNDRLAELEEEQVSAAHETEDNIRGQLARIETRLKGLRGMTADGLISNEEFIEDRRAFLAEKTRLEQQLGESPTERAGRLLEPWREGLSIANWALFRFQDGNPQEKRQVLKTTSSNLQLQAKTVLIQAEKILGTYRDLEKNSNWWACQESNLGPQHYQCCALTN